jgi:two-component system, OmpR family, sensor histidine kinase VanS
LGGSGLRGGADRLHVVNIRAIDLTEALLLLSRADQRSSPENPSTVP